MRLLPALGGGVAGACALTLLHEITRRVVPDAPRTASLPVADAALEARLNDELSSLDD